MAGRPYTKWYRVWERVTIADFYQELTIIPIILLFILIGLWGAAANRNRAKQWAKTYLPLLSAEYAAVGFGKNKLNASPEDEGLFKEKSKNECSLYCTGRQNVACLDINLTLYRRYNPFVWAVEAALSIFLDSFQMPVERVEATAHAFDGREKALAPNSESTSTKDSAYDGFVWALVHKDKMKQLREDRYDVSLTTTKDHPKLPSWATVMSESAEVTEALLTPELIKAVTDVGENFEALIISDQPIDAPKKSVFPCPHDTPLDANVLTSQAQRHGPEEARLSLHAPLHRPEQHRSLQLLPPPSRLPRQQRTFPTRSDAQDPCHPRGADPKNPPAR
jgi:hypothetical protein